jgi:hypothetical protein
VNVFGVPGGSIWWSHGFVQGWHHLTYLKHNSIFILLAVSQAYFDYLWGLAFIGRCCKFFAPSEKPVDAPKQEVKKNVATPGKGKGKKTKKDKVE